MVNEGASGVRSEFDPAAASEERVMTDESDGTQDEAAPSPLRSVYTNNLPGILAECGISLAVSTYQAGHVIIARPDGEALNTHFRRFLRPMGMATRPGQLALGTAQEILEFRDMTTVARKLEPPGRHDACYLPRDRHITGYIDVHEMAYGGEELWFVNTRFSCLCTLDRAHSFVPRWRPPFVSALSPGDRCHLNGVALVEGRPRYVTAMGTTDVQEGWRENKVHGGVVMEVDSGQIIASGLCMPHSPRWYRDRLWILESGDGSIGTVDPGSGRYHPVARLGGFTRGLAFYGPLAFIGLSQVRETATFSGLPLTERLSERICGVSVVHLGSGEEIAFVRFEDAVQEIFAVVVLPHRFPEILEPSDDRLANTYALPDEALGDVGQARSGP